MEKINVEEILLNHILQSVNAGAKDFDHAFMDMWMLLDPQPSSRVILKAIKEIAELIVDRCAEDAMVIVEATEKGQFQKAYPDKQSILNVKEEINYE